jgi:hypothetical protein
MNFNNPCGSISDYIHYWNRVFIRDNVLIIYLLPWSLYAIGALINFFNNSILSFIEGLNKIESVQRIRFFVSIVNTIIIVMVLMLGGNIYALSLGMLLSASPIFISLFSKLKGILAQLVNVSRGFVYNWKKEILPLSSKYVISFSGGYFMFQIYTPLMHYFHGPIYSGKVGITLALVVAIFNLWGIIPRRLRRLKK